MYALIMAGGSGTRLWPASRQKKPKQLLGFIGKQTLLQTTFERLRKQFSGNQIFVATGNAYSKNIQAQLPKIPKTNYSIEPCIKDRGPALGLAALIMYRQDPDSSFVTAWSDHYIKNEESYFSTLEQADKYLANHPEAFVTIGVTPTFAHTGLGYIQQGKLIDALPGVNIYQAKSFKEKPDTKLAEKFFQSKKYLWNTGYFVCKTAHLLKLYQQHMPEVYAILEKIKPSIGTNKQQQVINEWYPKMPKVDIERGLLEKLNNIVVLSANFDWVDVGSWRIIKDLLSLPHENVIKGKVLTHAAEGNLIYNYENKLVATVGLKDIVIINTGDVLLVANKNDSEQIKGLVKQLEDHKDLKKYL